MQREVVHEVVREISSELAVLTGATGRFGIIASLIEDGCNRMRFVKSPRRSWDCGVCDAPIPVSEGLWRIDGYCFGHSESVPLCEKCKPTVEDLAVRHAKRNWVEKSKPKWKVSREDIKKNRKALKRLGLSDWEREFCESIQYWIRCGSAVSAKQSEQIDRLKSKFGADNFKLMFGVDEIIKPVTCSGCVADDWDLSDVKL